MYRTGTNYDPPNSTRKVDLIVSNAVAGLASTAHKAATDIRLLASWKEIEE